jgi:hypothetical protein
MFDQLQPLIESNLAWITGVLGAFGGILGIILIYIVNIFFKINKVKKRPQKAINDLVYKLAYFIGKYINKIGDEKTRCQTRAFIDSLGDVANNAWDAGVKLQEKPKIDDN